MKTFRHIFFLIALFSGVLDVFANANFNLLDEFKDVGVPNLGGIHPYWLQLQMITRQVGIYSSPYLYQIP